MSASEELAKAAEVYRASGSSRQPVAPEVIGGAAQAAGQRVVADTTKPQQH